MSEPKPTDSVIEGKVKTTSATAAVSGLVLSLLGTFVFKSDVPDAVEGIVAPAVGTVVPGVLTFLAGWVSKHTPRSLVDIGVDQDNTDSAQA